jgi:hypothetical protein
MLNLVQLQERLKGVPIQALMQYANGANPQIPPFLALGELNRRKKMQEGAAAEQAQEMEGSTVKQQIEQATGLMALQGSRQRQAAQQQQGIQANMPMAAPNTTTSEPAQLAGGGFIDDVVVPRDYQRGGAVNPEMLKRLMMMKAMQNRRPGVAGLPINTFKRGDFAGGGIVAFAGTEGSLVNGRVDTSETMRKKAEQYREMLRRLFGKRAGEEDIDPADPTAMMGTPISEGARSLAEVKDSDDEMRAEAERRQRAFIDTLSGRKPLPTPQAVSSVPTVSSGPTAPTAPRRSTTPNRGEAPAIQPKTGILSLTDMTDEERLNNLRKLQRLAGVAENPFADIEKRYGEIEAEDKRVRADQPMDQLTRFLTSVATGPRGGTFGTQGAAGARASAQLRAEQQASNRKQDLDMAALRMSIAKEQDARARGDADAVRREKENQDKLKLDIAKLQSEDEYRKGLLDVQREGVEVQRERLVTDRARADQTRQMAEVNDFISNYRTKNAGNTKYITNPGLLEQDAIAAAIRFFGPQRFKDLGLAPGMEAGASVPSGPRPPISSFQK